MPNISLRFGLIRFNISFLEAGLGIIAFEGASRLFQRSVVEGKNENLYLSVREGNGRSASVPLSRGLGLWSLIISKRYFGFSRVMISWNIQRRLSSLLRLSDSQPRLSYSSCRGDPFQAPVADRAASYWTDSILCIRVFKDSSLGSDKNAMLFL